MSQAADHDDSTQVAVSSLSDQDSAGFPSGRSNIFNVLKSRATNLLNKVNELEKFSLLTENFMEVCFRKISDSLIMSSHENELSYHMKNLIGFYLAMQKTISFCGQDPPVSVSLPVFNVEQQQSSHLPVSHLVEPPKLSSEEIPQSSSKSSHIVQREYPLRSRKRTSVLPAVGPSEKRRNLPSEQISEPASELSKIHQLESQAKTKSFRTVEAQKCLSSSRNPTDNVSFKSSVSEASKIAIPSTSSQNIDISPSTSTATHSERSARSILQPLLDSPLENLIQSITGIQNVITPCYIPMKQSSHSRLSSLKKYNESISKYFESCKEVLVQEFDCKKALLNKRLLEIQIKSHELLISLFLFLLKEYEEFLEFLEGKEDFVLDPRQESSSDKIIKEAERLSYVTEDFVLRLPDVKNFYEANKSLNDKLNEFYQYDVFATDSNLVLIRPLTGANLSEGEQSDAMDHDSQGHLERTGGISEEIGSTDSLTGSEIRNIQKHPEATSDKEAIIEDSEIESSFAASAVLTLKPCSFKKPHHGKQFTISSPSPEGDSDDLSKEIEKIWFHLFYAKQTVFSLIVSNRDCTRAIVDKCFLTKVSHVDIRLKDYLNALLITVEGFKIIRSDWAEKIKGKSLLSTLKMKLKVALLIKDLMHSLLEDSFKFWNMPGTSHFMDFY